MSGHRMLQSSLLGLYSNGQINSNGQDGTSVMKVEVKVQAPKLRYMHLNCFEAGIPRMVGLVSILCLPSPLVLRK